MSRSKAIKYSPYDRDALLWAVFTDDNIWYLNPKGVWICYKPAIWVEIYPGIIHATCQKWIDKSLPPLQENPYVTNPNFRFDPVYGLVLNQSQTTIGYLDYAVYETEIPAQNNYQLLHLQKLQELQIQQHKFLQYQIQQQYHQQQNSYLQEQYQLQQKYQLNQSPKPDGFTTSNEPNNTPVIKTPSRSPSLSSIPEDEEDDFDYSDMPELVEVVSQNEDEDDYSDMPELVDVVSQNQPQNDEDEQENEIKPLQKNTSWVDDEDLSDYEVFD